MQISRGGPLAAELVKRSSRPPFDQSSRADSTSSPVRVLNTRQTRFGLVNSSHQMEK